MTDDALLDRYVQLAAVLGRMFAPVLEVVVHDLRTPDRSIVAIENGHVTGRTVGDAATDLGRRLLSGDFPDVLVGYANESPTGQPLKSSSLAIRDAQGALIGVVGLNLDVSVFAQFNTFLEAFILDERSPHVPEAERFAGTTPPGEATPQEEIRAALERLRLAHGFAGRTLSNAEKRVLVEALYREGHFKTRGAVTYIARALGLTRATVYNYRNDYVDQRS
jgi:predicted transcriptional regulator YheO